jgi:RNA recognition motif-containing protein
MSTTVYIAHLPDDITESKLRGLMCSSGQITRLEVIVDRFTGKPNGTAFCTYKTHEGARLACSDFTGFNYYNRALYVVMVDDQRDMDWEIAANSTPGAAY